jgi:phosphosulfolactate synthase (CoM biosynthesis protein A)
VRRAKRFLDVPAKFANALGLDKVMFEAAEPEVFQWYVKNYGPEVNLFIDHSQIIELEALRCGTWGTKSLWGRVATYKGLDRKDTRAGSDRDGGRLTAQEP